MNNHNNQIRKQTLWESLLLRDAEKKALAKTDIQKSVLRQGIDIGRKQTLEESLLLRDAEKKALAKTIWKRILNQVKLESDKLKEDSDITSDAVVYLDSLIYRLEIQLDAELSK